MRTVACIAVALGVTMLISATAHSAPIKLATWNMNNLHHVIGEPLRSNAPAWTETDYEILRQYRDRLGADVIALQEVNGPKAAALVFPPDQYDLYFSGRYIDDLVTGKATHSDPDQRSDRIYTGFAVRRGVFDAVSKRDLSSLGVIHAADGRSVRWGTELLLEKDGQLLRVLSVHLKSGCHGGSLENTTNPHCLTLAAQRAPLEEWIDEAAQGLLPFVILGDFNRRFDRFGEDDHFWRDIDDGDPAGLDLRRLPIERRAACNPSFPDPIDFLVFDDRAWQLVDQSSFAEITYDPEDRDAARGTPSDHCPISVSLELTAGDHGDDDEPTDTDTTDLDLLYAPADGLEGEELRAVLHEIARRGHHRLSYAEVWGALDFTDEDPANPANVILLYTGRSHPKPDKISSALNPKHDNDSWNREHVWPKSHWFPSEGQLAHTDIHHLLPADVTCNSDRGDLDFDESDFAHPECASRHDADSFEPRDAVKGDVARMLFYMDMRYAGAEGVPDLALIDNDCRSGPLLGHLCTLLAWNQAEPVDDLERRRHERIIDTQGNRNPFIDRPGFAKPMDALGSGRRCARAALPGPAGRVTSTRVTSPTPRSACDARCRTACADPHSTRPNSRDYEGQARSNSGWMPNGRPFSRPKSLTTASSSSAAKSLGGSFVLGIFRLDLGNQLPLQLLCHRPEDAARACRAIRRRAVIDLPRRYLVRAKAKVLRRAQGLDALV